MGLRKNFHLPLDKLIAGCFFIRPAVSVTAIPPYLYIRCRIAHYVKKKMTISEFEKWSRFASKLRDSAEEEKISFEDYDDWMRK